MTTTLKASIGVDLEARLAEALDLQTRSAPGGLKAAYGFQNGTGTTVGNADLLWSDRRSINASSNEDLDFAGSLTSAFGATLTFARIKAIMVKAASTNANNVVITRPASNGVPLFSAASDAISVLPGGLFLWVAPGAGVTVTASTGDLINISNSGSGTAVSYEIVVVGASA